MALPRISSALLIPAILTVVGFIAAVPQAEAATTTRSNMSVSAVVVGNCTASTQPAAVKVGCRPA